MDALFPAVAGFARMLEDPVHRADGTQKLTFIQQGGLHGGRRAILKTFLMQTSSTLARSASDSARAGEGRGAAGGSG